MAEKICEFDSLHQQNINDVQFDYFGSRIATCDSEGNIHIFRHDSSTAQPTKLGQIEKAHKGPIWQIAWTHPSFESMIISVGFDRKICLWKEQKKEWVQIESFTDFDTSVNCIALSPYQLGLIIAAGCSDGKICFFKWQNESNWIKSHFDIHKGSVLGISCGGLTKSNESSPSNINILKLATCGTDNSVYVLVLTSDTLELKESIKLNPPHENWVRDVAWCVDSACDTIASGSDDGIVKVWSNKKGNEYEVIQELNFKKGILKLSWSIGTNLLAICDSENIVTIIQEDEKGEWRILPESNNENTEDEKQNN